MPQMIPLSVRVDESVKEKAEAIAESNSLEPAEILRFALSAGLSVVDDIAKGKREDIDLPKAMVIHSVGLDYT